MVLMFVQRAIGYKFDRDSTGEFPGGPYAEYGRFAVETVYDQVGDCECTSLLCASLLAYLGFSAALLWVVVPTDTDSNGVNHIAVGLEVTAALRAGLPDGSLDTVEALDGTGRRYLYGETALDGFVLPFGCLPDWGQLKIEKVVPIVPVTPLKAAMSS
jgi:hypothetical protein